MKYAMNAMANNGGQLDLTLGDTFLSKKSPPNARVTPIKKKRQATSTVHITPLKMMKRLGFRAMTPQTSQALLQKFFPDTPTMMYALVLRNSKQLVKHFRQQVRQQHKTLKQQLVSPNWMPIHLIAEIISCSTMQIG